MQGAVQAAPLLAEALDQRAEVTRVVDVELEHLRRPGKSLGDAARQRQAVAAAGQDNLGPEPLRLLGDAVGDALARDDAGDEDALARQHCP